MVEKIKKSLDSGLMVLLSVLVFLILVSVVWQVFSRYVLKAPAIFTEEVVRFFLVWLALLGASYGFGSGKHLALTLVFERMPSALRYYTGIFLILVTCAVAVFVLIYGGITLMLVAQGQVSAVLAIPMSYVYIVLPLSGTITLVYQICILIRMITDKGSL